MSQDRKNLEEISSYRLHKVSCVSEERSKRHCTAATGRWRLKTLSHTFSNTRLHLEFVEMCSEETISRGSSLHPT